MKRERRRLNERGQSLALVAVLIFLLLAMLALILDGGYAYYERRRAQNAADAGALAGAAALCETGNEADAIAVAREYAETRNMTVAGSISASRETGVVSVTTQITYNTFFAALLGRPEMTVSAVAEAGCFAPGYATGVLPIAWSCRPPVAGSDSADCEIEFGTKPCKWGEDPIYLLMDSETTEMDVYCKDPMLPPEEQVGEFDCDLNDDGVNDITLLSGGDRAWLDLDGNGKVFDGTTERPSTCPKTGGGSAELKDWIEKGLQCQLDIHTWVPGHDGNKTTAYKAVDTYHVKPYPYPSDHEVLIPVYDALCQGDPRSATECWTANPAYTGNWYHYPPDKIVEIDASKPVYYHVITFARFQPTCVFDGGGSSGCPARDWAVDEGIITGGDINSLKTIEGCFIEGYSDSVGGTPSSGVDAGAYNIFLSK